MRLQCIGIAALTAVCFISCAAQADTKVVAKAGAWETFDGTTTNGTAVCGMSSSPGGRYFGLKHFAGRDTFTVQLGGKGIRVRNGAKYKVTMQLDRHALWRATGTGMHFNDGDPGLEYNINKSELYKFMREFGNSRRLRVDFPSSVGSAWDFELDGVGAVRAAFESCDEKL
jgi:hypothetical protein